MLAAQLAAFPMIKTRIVDRRPPARSSSGRPTASPAAPWRCSTRSDSAERLLKEAYWVNETSFWKPDPADRTRIVRSGRIQDTEDGLSEFPHVIVNQARLHDYLLEVMRQLRRPARRRDYGVSCVRLEVATDGDPVTVTLRVELAAATMETHRRARYVVGCDGARSVCGRRSALQLRGDVANHAWGVMDVLAVTDFPDIRLKTAIHSADEGSLADHPARGRIHGALLHRSRQAGRRRTAPTIRDITQRPA